MKYKLIIGVVFLAAMGSCTHPSVPEGHEGYIYHIPLIWGKAEYRETLRGPSSTGIAWRLYTKNIDIRPRSYKEDFNLLTSDNLSVEFEVNTRVAIRAGTVKEIVEIWGAENWYDSNIREPLRTIVRREITAVRALDLQLKTEEVKIGIRNQLESLYDQNTPIIIHSVDIGNIRFPKEVTAAIERKIAKQQELERQEFVLAKTHKEAAIRVLEALKVAKQQRIIRSTLDPLYVQRLAVQVYRLLASSDNKTVVVLPNSSKGTGMPRVLSGSKRKRITASDRKLLRDMEKRYMNFADQTSKKSKTKSTRTKNLKK